MSFYPEFEQEPSKPHQCIWVNEDTGIRCRSYAAHNQYTCFHHQIPDMPPVFSNDAFPIRRAETRDSVQSALADILVRLAANQVDIKRAGILLYGLQIASCNLQPHPRPATPAPIVPAESVISNEIESVISTEGGARAAAVERPPHFAPAQPQSAAPQPATNNQQPTTVLSTLQAATASTDHLPLTTRLSPPSPQPKLRIALQRAYLLDT
jgi:hypothetical protein